MRVTPIIKLIVTAYFSPQLHGTGSQVKQINRGPSLTVPLDRDLEKRFQGLAEEAVMVDVHQHPFVFPEDMSLFIDYLRTNSYSWGYEAVKHGGWSAVATANVMRGFLSAQEISFIEFDDLLAEVGLMLADLSLQSDVVKVGNADDIESAKQQGKVGSCLPWNTWPSATIWTG